MEKEKSKRGESLAKRHSRSVHEKKRRAEVNDVLAEMAELASAHLIACDPPNDKKKPDKCYVIGAAVQFIKENVKEPSNYFQISPSNEENSYLMYCIELVQPCIVTLHGWLIKKIMGSAETTFGISEDRMLRNDLRRFLSFESAMAVMTGSPHGWSSEGATSLKSSLGKSFQCTASKHTMSDGEVIWLLTCTKPDEFKDDLVTEENFNKDGRRNIIKNCPLLASLLSKDSDEPPKLSKPLNVQTASSLGCVSPSTSFLSPSSSSGASSFCQHTMSLSSLEGDGAKKLSTEVRKKKKVLKRKKVSSKKCGADKVSSTSKKPAKRVEQADENALEKVTASTSESYTGERAAVGVQATVSNTAVQPVSVLLGAFESFSPAYKEIWLRLQSERLLLEERVLEKQRELRNLMFSSLSFPSSLSLLSSSEQQIPSMIFAERALPATTQNLLMSASNPFPTYGTSWGGNANQIYQSCQFLTSNDLRAVRPFDNLPSTLANSLLVNSMLNSTVHPKISDSQRVDVFSTPSGAPIFLPSSSKQE